MTPEHWRRIKEVLEEALELSGEARATYLRRACGENQSLRAEVESLLLQDQKSDTFLIPSKPSTDHLVRGESLLHYEILELLGAGGMGVVYKARDQRLQRFVAIKVVQATGGADEERKRRFLQEARAASALNHPNIVTVFDIGSHESFDFIVMEFIAGRPLSDLIGSQGMKLSLAMKLAVQITYALTAAHSAGIVHRDLKPGNILVSATDVVKVLDFGLAKVTDTRLREWGEVAARADTADGIILGTVPYMSPEQAAGGPIDSRSDVFSFGSVLYEMVTGRRAFDAETPMGAIAAILNREPEIPSTLVHGLPVELDELITRCLCKRREDRIQDIAQVGFALEVITSADVPGKPARADLRPPKARRVGDSYSSYERKDRDRVLRRIRRDWVEGVLYQSLWKLTRIQLEIESRPDAIEHPLNALLRSTKGSVEVIPKGTGVREIFAAHGEALLILGAPGMGKTTLLLELLRDLLDEAQRDDNEAIPMVFNLSSWGRARKPLETWLVDEIQRNDYAPKPLAEEWVQEGRVVLLLDGLDEVVAEYRADCVNAINKYRHENPLVPIVVCSRISDYEALRVKVRLRSAIEVRPLTEQQVMEHLAEIGTPAKNVTEAARTNPLLADLIRSPLMLWITLLAHFKHPMEPDLPWSTAQLQNQVIGTYIEVMVNRRAVNSRFSQEKVLQWASWIAFALRRSGLSVFYLEDLCPSFIASTGLRRSAHAVSFFSILVILSMMMSVGYDRVFYFDPLPGAMFGPVLALIGTLGPLRPVDRLQFKRSLTRRQLGGALRLTLLTTLLFGMVFIITGILITVHTKNWELVFSVAVTSYTILGALVLGLAAGVIHLILAESSGDRSRPNEGTLRSIRFSLITMALTMLLIVGADQASANTSLTMYIVRSCAVWGTLAGAFAGGLFTIRHFALRLMLATTGLAPLNYVQFLEHASSALLLRRVGNGYVFMHRMIMEHLARRWADNRGLGAQFL